VGLDGDLDVVFEVPVLGVCDVADAEEFFDLLPTLVGDGDGACLLVDDEVSGPGFVSRVSISSPASRRGMMRLTRMYLSVVSSVGPEMMSGVRASSMRMESTSSTMQK